MLHLTYKIHLMAGQVNLDALIKREDLFKLSDEEAMLITGAVTLQDAAKILMEKTIFSLPKLV